MQGISAFAPSMIFKSLRRCCTKRAHIIPESELQE
jgi:hypothetical protein